MGDISRDNPNNHYYVHDQNGAMVARPKSPPSPGFAGALRDAAGAVKSYMGVSQGPTVVTPTGTKTPAQIADEES